jgi:chemotaxis-related protein WspD
LPQLPGVFPQCRLLLDRAMPGADEDGLSTPLPAAVSGEPAQSLMAFRLGGMVRPAHPSLDEIVGPRPVHSLPHRRNPALLGLVNVRGELVICVSLAGWCWARRAGRSGAGLDHGGAS